MPSRPGGGSGGRRNEQAAANGKRPGRRAIPLAQRKLRKDGKVAVLIDPACEMVIPVDLDTRMLAQRLMLYPWPDVATVEELFSFALRRLAETT